MSFSLPLRASRAGIGGFDGTLRVVQDATPFF
jgi:hypothetical protein